MPKQVPVPDELSKPFWDACNRRRLIVQNCTTCNRMQYPPEPTCSKCGSKDHLEWKQVSGRGRINGYCVMYDSRIRVLQADQPFNIAVIELEEDPEIKMLSHLPGTPVDQVPLGAAVQVEFQQVSPNQLVHEWRVVESQPRSRNRRRRQ
ncbi:MAG: OB-fold domain-containing protein [Chloroflexi bacterium]|nr:OB-fold domain-containing protein [Chloroflexota bacterium]